MRGTISVAVTNYNNGVLVRRCVESIVHQLNPGDELLLLDDCSTDDSLDYLRQASSGHQQIIFFGSQTNRGQSHLRNIAIDQARGDFIVFVDGDDQLGEAALSAIREVLESSDVVDYVSLSCLQLRPGGVITELPYHFPRNTYLRVFSYQEIINQFLERPHSVNDFTHCWGRTYRLETLRRKNIRFDEDLHQAEDLVFNCQYLGISDAQYFIYGEYYLHTIHNSLSAKLGDDPNYWANTLKSCKTVYKSVIGGMGYNYNERTFQHFVSSFVILAYIRAVIRPIGTVPLTTSLANAKKFINRIDRSVMRSYHPNTADDNLLPFAITFRLEFAHILGLWVKRYFSRLIGRFGLG